MLKFLQTHNLTVAFRIDSHPHRIEPTDVNHHHISPSIYAVNIQQARLFCQNHQCQYRPVAPFTLLKGFMLFDAYAYIGMRRGLIVLLILTFISSHEAIDSECMSFSICFVCLQPHQKLLNPKINQATTSSEWIWLARENDFQLLGRFCIYNMLLVLCYEAFHRE